MAFLAQLWRYPIKAYGRETIERADLSLNQTLPWDRAWAVLREQGETPGQAWVHCRNFSRAARSPKLQALTAHLDEERQRLTLTHPDLGSFTFDPAQDEARFLSWIAPLTAPEHPKPIALIRSPNRGMTDTQEPTISLHNFATHEAVTQQAGLPLSHTRWRGNLWLAGLPPWEEMRWIGKTIRLGEAELHITAAVDRCQAPSANPATGTRDTDILRVLQQGWNHTDFGVFGIVTRPGKIALGDRVEVIE
jgi:uncharacterized protein YcbX